MNQTQVVMTVLWNEFESQRSLTIYYRLPVEQTFFGAFFPFYVLFSCHLTLPQKAKPLILPVTIPPTRPRSKQFAPSGQLIEPNLKYRRQDHGQNDLPRPVN